MGEFPPQGRQSRGTTRAHKLLVHVPAALWKCWAPRYWWTYQRRCVNDGPKGFDSRAGTSAGQPTRELVDRVTVVVSGNPAVFFNTAGTPERVSKELHMVRAWLVLRPAWLDFCLRPIFLYPLSFSSLVAFVPLLPQCRPSLRAYLSLRHIWADYSWAQRWAGFRRRLPGPWPAAWTRGGVGLNCQLKLSYVFSFVESVCVDDDRPSYPRVKGMCTDVDGCGQCVQSWNPGRPAVNCLSRCECVLAWLPGSPVLNRQYRL